MKWFIASDIHGSACWCRKMLECYKAEKADRMLLLGDILYHGPRNDLPAEYAPKAVIEMLNNIKDEIINVRGNCDTEVDQMVLQFPVLADYAYIADEKATIFATHGHIYNAENMPPLKNGDVLLHGHTHVPACEQHSGITYINPGSVSIPKENSHHGYIIFENRRFIWKDFDSEIHMQFMLS